MLTRSARRAACVSLLVLACAGTSRAADPSVDSDLEKVLRDLTALPAKDPTAGWRALPDTFKKELTGIWTDTLDKMDADLWDKSFAVAQKGIKLLKAKKDILVDQLANNPDIQKHLTKKELAEFYDAEVDALDVLLNSDISKLESARKLEVEKFMGELSTKTSKQVTVVEKYLRKLDTATGGAMMPGLRGQMPGSTVSSVKMDGAKKAVVTFKAPDGETSEVVFAKFDGQWYPKEIGDTLTSSLPLAKEMLGQAKAEDIKKMKPLVLGVLKKVDAGLDKLAATKTSEEFLEEAKALGQDLVSGFVR